MQKFSVVDGIICLMDKGEQLDSWSRSWANVHPFLLRMSSKVCDVCSHHVGFCAQKSWVLVLEPKIRDLGVLNYLIFEVVFCKSVGEWSMWVNGEDRWDGVPLGFLLAVPSGECHWELSQTQGRWVISLGLRERGSHSSEKSCFLSRSCFECRGQAKEL